MECLGPDIRERILKETQGIRTHFWWETKYKDNLGKKFSLTEEKDNSLLRISTEIGNLEEVNEANTI